MNREHSVFVYGTLRPGQSNYRRLLADRTVREVPASAKGLALYSNGFPYAVPQLGARVIGDLITIKPELYQEVLADLDRLEGYRPGHPDHSHYIRTTRSVVVVNHTPNGGAWEAFHTAWVYIAGPMINPLNLPRVADDDWCAVAR